MHYEASRKTREFTRNNRDRPSFFNYSVSLPHMPIDPGNLLDAYVSMYSKEDVPLRDNVFDSDGQLHRDEL